MIRGTTSTVTLDIPFKEEDVAYFEVTFFQHKEILTKSSEDTGVTVSDYKIVLDLTQDELLLFSAGESGQGYAKVQVRFVMEDGSICASDRVLVPIGEILKNGVIKHNE